MNLEYRSDDWRNAAGYTSYLFEDIYENEIYYTDTSVTPNVDYHGARFAVEILTDDEIDADAAITDKTAAKANADILRHIFDNYGTMNPGDTVNNDPKYQNCRMYITSDEVDALADPLPTFRKDDYTDFEVPRYYSLAGDLQSWAPNHVAELTLYREDPAAAGTYLKDPWLKIRSGLGESMRTTSYDPAVYNGHWSMEFAFKSSKLVAEDGTALTYQMVVEKTSHLTYTHTAIALNTTTFVGTWYDTGTMKFSFASPISLFCGDIAPTLPGPNQLINDQDRNLLAGFNYGVYTWNDSRDDAKPAEWSNSTYNPYSYAYMADLNGDGIISERDLAILMSEFNWMRDGWDYGAPKGLDFGSSGIMLLMEEFFAGEEAGEESVEGEETVEDTDTEEGTGPEEPTETPESPNGSEDPGETDHAEDPGNVEGPAEPSTPADPGAAGDTDMPEEPTEPEGDAEPEPPAEPKDPDTADTPEVPEEPSVPAPAEPEAEPDQPSPGPDVPVEPKDPGMPGESEGSETLTHGEEIAGGEPAADFASPKE